MCPISMVQYYHRLTVLGWFRLDLTSSRLFWHTEPLPCRVRQCSLNIWCVPFWHMPSRLHKNTMLSGVPVLSEIVKREWWWARTPPMLTTALIFLTSKPRHGAYYLSYWNLRNIPSPARLWKLGNPHCHVKFDCSVHWSLFGMTSGLSYNLSNCSKWVWPRPDLTVCSHSALSGPVYCSLLANKIQTDQ